MHETPKKGIKQKVDVINQLGIDPPTILIATHIRFYPPAAGNELRILLLVKYLRKIGYRIIMLVNPFLEKSKLDREARSILHKYVDYYEELGDLPIDGSVEIPLDAGIENESILGRWKPTEESFCPDAMMQRATSLIQEFSPKIIVAEYIWMSRILALAAPDMLKVIDTHDMFSQKNENAVRFGIHDSLAITPEEELAFINRSNVTIAIQDIEAAAFRKLEPACRVITAGMDLDMEQVHESRNDDTRPPTLLIVGSGNQINVHCVKEFLEKAWPRIHQHNHACRLRIIGKVTNSLMITDPSVELVSYVEDLDSAYEETAVVINPVYAGTGLKVESIEALGHRKALVCWPEGAAGLTSGETDPFIIIQSWDELVDAVVDLLSHPEKRRDLEKEARHFAMTRLSDRVVYRETADCFDAVSKRKLSVLCLYLRYGLNDHPHGLSDLQDWYARKMTNAQTTTWIIDNKLKTEVDGVDPVAGFRLLSGDNRQREFSAFQKVLTEHRAEIEKYDIVHFVTSAFNTLFTGYLDYFQVDHLAPVAHRPICLGHIDTYDEPIQLTGETSQSWIRTCFFFMSPESIYSIPGFVSFHQESQFFDAEGNFRSDGGLSANYRQYISGWLTGETMQGVSWHSTIPDAKSFAGKTLAILNEHMLSIQVRNAGIHLMDYYWLKDYSQDLSSSIDHFIPDSLQQAQYRQEHLFGKAQN
jgi:glycosyltransferase involved in cell wall biosynthesis